MLRSFADRLHSFFHSFIRLSVSAGTAASLWAPEPSSSTSVVNIRSVFHVVHTKCCSCSVSRGRCFSDGGGGGSPDSTTTLFSRRLACSASHHRTFETSSTHSHFVLLVVPGPPTLQCLMKTFDRNEMGVPSCSSVLQLFRRLSFRSGMRRRSTRQMRCNAHEEEEEDVVVKH